MNKKIGFLDHNLENFHSATFLKLFRGPLSDLGWEVSCCWAERQEEGRAWAAANNLPFAGAPDELADCDAIMILAPRNPERHLDLVRMAVPLGRPIYLDKPFADTLASALEIYRMADAGGVRLMSTSALRCAQPLLDCVSSGEEILHVRAWGGSGSFREYAIHATEMVVSVLGADAEKIWHHRSGEQTIIHIDFKGGRSGTVFFHPNSSTRYQVMVSTEKETRHIDCTGPTMFENLGRLVVRFFESGVEEVPREQTLRIRQILDVAENGEREGTLHALPTILPL